MSASVKVFEDWGDGGHASLSKERRTDRERRAGKSEIHLNPAFQRRWWWWWCVWREGGEDEGERRGLSLGEALRTPFWSPCGARPVHFLELSSGLFWRSLVARGALRTTITEEGGDDSQRMNRVIDWYGVLIVILLCVLSVRAHFTLKNHILARKSTKYKKWLHKAPFLPYTSRRLRW